MCLFVCGDAWWGKSQKGLHAVNSHPSIHQPSAAWRRACCEYFCCTLYRMQRRKLKFSSSYKQKKIVLSLFKFLYLHRNLCQSHKKPFYFSLLSCAVCDVVNFNDNIINSHTITIWTWTKKEYSRKATKITRFCLKVCFQKKKQTNLILAK